MRREASSGFADLKVPSRSKRNDRSSELELMREAGRIVAFAVNETAGAVVPGVSTRELDAIARQAIEARGARPAFLGLYGFPATACISINEEIVHGIPGERIVGDGDLVSIDCGAIAGRMYSDHAVTVVAGRSGALQERLVEACKAALEAGIAEARPGNRVGDISHAIEKKTVSFGFVPVREYTGHGIGRRLHEPPDVPNLGPAGRGPLLREGMYLAIEPIVAAGGWQTRLQDDGWTVVTADGSLSAHYEHTVAILADGPEVLTSQAG